MHDTIEIGLSSEFKIVVREEHSAISFGSGCVNVLATPCLVSNLEKAAFNAVDDKLGKNYTTVGTKVNIDHVAATPIGMKVIFKAKVISVNKSRLLFEVESYDEKEKIGFGTHERCIINIDKFMLNTNNKIFK